MVTGMVIKLCLEPCGWRHHVQLPIKLRVPSAVWESYRPFLFVRNALGADLEGKDHHCPSLPMPPRV